MKERGTLGIIASVLVILFTASGFEVNVDYFTNNGYGNPVASIQHPSAEHYNGKTYIAYQGPHEDPYVCMYDHRAKKWTGPVKAGVNPMGKAPDTTNPDAIDNHGRPAMIIDAKGYIHLVFGGHGGDENLGQNMLGTPGKGKQIHSVSHRPEDISSWNVIDNISPFGTYSQFVKMQDDDIYLFYRHGSHRSDWVYQKSSDNGRTFSAPVSVLKHKVRAEDPYVHDAWYAWFEKGKGDTITVSYIYHLCAVKNHAKNRFNGYYMQMNCCNETWENVKGKILQVPVTREIADAYTLVCDTKTEASSHGTNRVDEDGNPHVFFRQGKSQIRYYRWSGNAWLGPSIVSPDRKGQDGDMIVESDKVIKMLLSQGEAGGGEVCWWETRDGGLTWKKGTCLIASENATFDVDAMVLNGNLNARMVVSERADKKNHVYRKLFLLGDNGPVPRPEQEANNLTK